MAKNNKFRVYIEQVNQTFVEVSAPNEEAAREKGYRKWRKEDAHSRIMSVSKIDDPKGEYGCQSEFDKRKHSPKIDKNFVALYHHHCILKP